MQPFTDAQLQQLLADLESDRAERKESFRGKSPETVREAVCAFANDLVGHGEAGVVLIGFACTFKIAVIPALNKNVSIETELQRQLPWQHTERGTLFAFVHGMSSGDRKSVV